MYDEIIVAVYQCPHSLIACQIKYIHSQYKDGEETYFRQIYLNWKRPTQFEYESVSKHENDLNSVKINEESQVSVSDGQRREISTQKLNHIQHLEEISTPPSYLEPTSANIKIYDNPIFRSRDIINTQFIEEARNISYLNSECFLINSIPIPNIFSGIYSDDILATADHYEYIIERSTGLTLRRSASIKGSVIDLIEVNRFIREKK